MDDSAILGFKIMGTGLLVGLALNFIIHGL